MVDADIAQTGLARAVARFPEAAATLRRLALTDPEFSKWMVSYRQSGGEAKVVAAGSTVNPSNVEALGDLAAGGVGALLAGLFLVRRP